MLRYFYKREAIAMKQNITAKLKLDVSREQKDLLRCASLAYRDALNYTSIVAFDLNNCGSADKLQKEVYSHLRSNFKLPSQMACNVPRQVAASYRVQLTKLKQNQQAIAQGKTRKRFKGLDKPLQYSSRTMFLNYGRDFSFVKGQVSIGTLEGRIKVNYFGYNLHLEYIKQGAKIGGAKVWYCKSSKTYYLLVSLEIEVPAVDQLTYTNNQSTETIPQYNFPEVAETMFGSGPGGTTLSAFTAGSTQTFSSTWVKNHRWAAVSSATWNYDSTLTGKIIVWVENDATKTVYQAAAAVVSTGVLGVNAIAGESGSMDVYPNPATNTANVALKLNSAADVTMEVYNVAGQLAFSMPSEKRNAGTSVSSVDVSNFANGTYFMKITVGNEVLTKKFTVAK